MRSTARPGIIRRSGRPLQGVSRTALHRSLDPNARFRYINIAVWASPEEFQAAVNHPDFVAYRERVPFAHYPSVYMIVG